ncbi:MAG: hypothetical protein H6863_03765 [Rhodospirillales bacterium]|nr:hypothetical protein [Rhodospirillales bacterium]
MNQWNAQRKEKLSDELSDALKNIKKGEMEKLKKQKSNAWKTSVAFAVLAALAISVGCWWYFTQEPKIVEKLKVETVYQDQPVFWNTLSPEQKDNYLAKGMAYFPEVFSTKYSTKYQNFNAWILEQGVTVPNTNDLFSAGGRDYINVSGKEYRVPRVFVHLDEHFDEVISAIKNANDQDLKASGA